MDWILNHLFLVLVVVAAIANAVKKLSTGGQKTMRKAIDPDADERTRRVQAEIRRKIAERTAQQLGIPQPGVPPPLPSPAPNVFRELAQRVAEAKRIAEMQARQRTAVAEAQAQTRAQEDERARQQAEAQQRVQARHALQKKQQAEEESDAYGTSKRKTSATDARDSLLADLRGKDSVRRALILREILGEPVGMR